MLGLEVRKLDCSTSTTSNNNVMNKRRSSARKIIEQPLPRDLMDVRQSMVVAKTERKGSTLL
jgi:hypothetical protein